MRPVRTAGAGLLLFSLVALWPAIPGAQSGRAMTIDDLIGAVRVADPQLSPDGRTVVFVRTTTDLKSGRRNADLWAVPAEGGAAKELIGGDKSENTPRWSPSGKQLAFISTRDGDPQVYVADADGSSVRRITELAKGVQPPLIFSPDGTRIAFVSDVYPECADEACNKRRKDEIEKNPVKARRLTRLLSRHWDEWRENVRHHVMVADLQSKRVVDVTPGDFDSPPGQAGRQRHRLFARRQGARLRLEPRRQRSRGLDDEQRRLPRAGDRRRREEADAGRRRRHAAGLLRRRSTIFVRAQRRGSFESDRWYLDAYDRARGTKRVVFESPDLSVGDYALSPDGSAIWFVAGEQGRENLYTVPAAGGTPKRIAEGGAISAPSPGSGFVVFSKSSMTAPPQVFRISSTGSGEKALTTENEALTREVAFTAVGEPDREGQRRRGRAVLAGQARRTSTPRGSIRWCS